MSRLALLVGCCSYRDPKFQRLEKPDADVEHLAQLLRDPSIGAFDEVQTSIDENFASVQVRVGRLFANRHSDDLVLLFFAGHGVKDEGGQLHLALTDTEADLLNATALSADFLVRQMDRSRSRKQLLILDCCFSGAFKGTRAPAHVGAASTLGEGVGRVVLTATDSFQYSWENEEQLSPTNSVFTHFLVEGLVTGRADTDNDGVITADNWYDYVYTQVRTATPNQTPQRSVHGGAGSLFVAHNPHTLLPLPQELIALIAHLLPGVREAAIDELTRLLVDPLDPLARSAREALEKLSSDRDAKVRARARDALTAPTADDPVTSVTPLEKSPFVDARPFLRRAITVIGAGGIGSALILGVTFIAAGYRNANVAARWTGALLVLLAIGMVIHWRWHYMHARWRHVVSAVLIAAAILTGAVGLSVDSFGREELASEFDLTATSTPTATTQRASTIPTLTPPSNVRVFLGNLHAHTSYSDGSGTPTDAYTYARDIAHLDFLAITEHNHTQAGGGIARDHSLYNGVRADSLITTAERFNEPGRFVALYGQEFSSVSSGNHANVLEVGDVIDETQVPNGQWDDLLDTWLPAHPDSQGLPAIIHFNHPSLSDSPNNKEYGIDDYPSMGVWRATLHRHAHLINMITGPSHEEGGKPSSPSESEFLRYLNMGFHLAPTADQDNHRTNWGTAATTRTGIWAPTLSKPDILSALRERRAYATNDQNLRIIGTVNGELMGHRFTGLSVPPVGKPLTIQLSIDDADEPRAEYTIDVFRNTVGLKAGADVVKHVLHDGNGTVTISDVAYEGGHQYVFVKLTQRASTTNAGDQVGIPGHAWLAPVWFEPRIPAR